MTFMMGGCNGDLLLMGGPKIAVTAEEEEKIQEEMVATTGDEGIEEVE